MEPQAEIQSPAWLDRPVIQESFKLKAETVLVIFIILVTILSRFTMLGERVMSHDETNHVVPSWELYMGKGYAHNPVTHGPFQFHIVALTYFLFGDNDTTSRIPAALFSTAAVIFVLFAFRRYLGRAGAILAAFFFTISPYMLFYGRYTRNEAFIELFGVVMIYAVLRYMDRGDRFALLLLTSSIVLHLCSKETAFIYVAQLLVVLALLFVQEIYRAERDHPRRFARFVLMVGTAVVLLLVAIGMGAANAKAPAAAPAANQPLQAVTPAVSAFAGGTGLAVEAICAAAALALGIIAFVLLLRDLGWKQIRGLRSFSLLVLVGTLILPQLTAFPVKLVGWDPLDYSSAGLLHTGLFLGLFLLISIVIGILWNWRLWLTNAAIFYGVFVFFYTTMFTNANGFFTGIVGSLGYWLSQQGVNRGSQPWFYFALIQVPVYEFLALLGTLLAAYFGFRHLRLATLPGFNPSSAQAVPAPDEPLVEDEEVSEASIPAAPETVLSLENFYAKPQPVPTLAILLFWSLTSLVAYSIAGEKMPWLTVHIALPMLLCAGWGIGYLLDTTRWPQASNRSGLITLLLLPVFFTSFAACLGVLLGGNPPFAGHDLTQLQSTSLFILSTLSALGSLAGILYLLRGWEAGQVLRLMTLTFFAILTVLTARAAYRASFINYDLANEYLVYAHGGNGPKQALTQIEEISRRTTRGKDLVVAYSDDALYPYWWYLRDYPNKKWYGKNPTRELQEAPVIIAGEDVFGKIDPVVADNYIMYDYMRLWWPMQDYYKLSDCGPNVTCILSLEKIWGTIRSPEMRSALFDIWLNRDYTAYAKLTNNPNLTVSSWQPSAHMRLYIRKDIVAQIWNYGAAPAAVTQIKQDPYKDNLLSLSPEKMFGSAGPNEGQFNAPRGISIAADGSLYVADSRNNRIQHISGDGAVLQTWGTFADVAKGDAPGGTFNEPWDVAVGKDGSVYVSDTWNHRIQKFSAEGKFLQMWGYFGQAEKPDAFWGPRALAVDSQGRIYVTDTGNKRVAIFQPDGTFVAQFGSTGMDIGQFDEPVGLAVDKDGLVYVADTWNQRVQVFQPDSTGANYTPLRQWEVSGWFGQSLDNKPFIKVSPLNGDVFLTDPEGYRVLEFKPDGTFVHGWGSYSQDINGFGLASGITVDAEGRVWVSDGANNRLMRYTVQ